MLALHPVTLEQGGFEQALGAVARQAARQGGFEIQLDVAPQALGYEDELLLAVARELLNNAARHSQAHHVAVAIANSGDALELQITDDGTGMPAERPSQALAEGHIGIASVNERVRAAGGEFELESSDAGTRARATLPISAAA
jgi:two-component system NarL family sensor kinase